MNIKLFAIASLVSLCFSALAKAQETPVCADEISVEDEATLGRDRQDVISAAQRDYQEASADADRSERFILRMGYLKSLHNTINDYRLKELKLEFGDDYIDDRVIQGFFVKHHREWKTLTHCALVAKTPEDKTTPFYQVELANAQRIRNAPELNVVWLNWKVALYGIQIGPKPNFDVVEFYNENNRALLDKIVPPTGDDPVCVKPGTKRLEVSEYRKCFQEYVRAYPSKHPGEIRKYLPMQSNCCHFAEELLDACGLTTCFTLPKRASPFHKKGSLEYRQIGQCRTIGY